MAVPIRIKPLFWRGIWSVVFACLASITNAQSYPAKPIRIVVAFAPGGSGDITARTVAQKMAQAMGQQFVIDNRPGAGGIVAAESVARTEPDGYTLLALNNGNAISAALFKSLPFDITKDFAPISTVGRVNLAVLVPAASPIRSVKELISQAKARPGKLNLGTTNIGGTAHLAAELFKSMAGVDIVSVPFTGTGDVITALRGNSVDVAFEFTAPVMGQIKSGTLRAIAVSSSTRSTVLPDVPTLAEAGVPGYEAISWNGLAAPKKTPAAIVARLNKEVHAAVAAAEVRQRLEELGVEPFVGSPEAAADLVAADIAKWNGVIDKAKIARQ